MEDLTGSLALCYTKMVAVLHLCLHAIASNCILHVLLDLGNLHEEGNPAEDSLSGSHHGQAPAHLLDVTEGRVLSA